MSNQKYKILVLSDMKNTVDTILKSTISLSQIIDADIEFLHVMKPTDIVDTESQLSAMRTINNEHLVMDKKIKKLLEPLHKDYNVKINFSISCGHIKSEISDCIKSCKPDIIVLGKKKSSALSFIGDNVTDFIFKNHEGAVLIAAGNNLSPNSELSLGILNDSNENINLEYVDSLLTNTKKPLQSFTFIDRSKNSKLDSIISKKNTVEYVFDQGDNTVKNLCKYLTKSNVNLLFLNRAKNASNKKLLALSSKQKAVINNVNVSLLFSNTVNPIGIVK